MEIVVDTSKGLFMFTYTGRKVNPGTITKNDINIEDIARSLSNICRFNGHCKTFYSVAQHSVYVSRIAESLGGDPIRGLLHDATECYVGDMIRPVKYRDEMKSFIELEDSVMDVIADKFGIIGEFMTPDIKIADNIALFTEKDQILANNDDWGWGYEIPRMEEKIELMYPPDAYNFFMKRYNELFNTT